VILSSLEIHSRVPQTKKRAKLIDGAVEAGATGGEAEDGWGPDGANGERQGEGDAAGPHAGVQDGRRGHAGNHGGS